MGKNIQGIIDIMNAVGTKAQERISAQYVKNDKLTLDVFQLGQGMPKK